jgi:hypothetical protein
MHCPKKPEINNTRFMFAQQEGARPIIHHPGYHNDYHTGQPDVIKALNRFY